jgi:hypothetical protein
MPMDQQQPESPKQATECPKRQRGSKHFKEMNDAFAI